MKALRSITESVKDTYSKGNAMTLYQNLATVYEEHITAWLFQNQAKKLPSFGQLAQGMASAFLLYKKPYRQL